MIECQRGQVLARNVLLRILLTFLCTYPYAFTLYNRSSELFWEHGVVFNTSFENVYLYYRTLLRFYYADMVVLRFYVVYLRSSICYSFCTTSRSTCDSIELCSTRWEGFLYTFSCDRVPCSIECFWLVFRIRKYVRVIYVLPAPCPWSSISLGSTYYRSDDHTHCTSLFEPKHSWKRSVIFG